MPRATHRLDLCYVISPVERRPIVAMDSLWEALLSMQVIDASGLPGARSGWLMSGFGRLRRDQPSSVVLYANQLGGMRVRCPQTAVSIVSAFVAATTAWRAGGERALRCPSCGERHALEALDFAPPAMFGSLAMVIVDAAQNRASQAFEALTMRYLGPTVRVLRRP